MSDDPKRPRQGKDEPPPERPSDDPTYADEEELDEALEDTFPASDPLPPPTRPGRDD